MIILELSYAIAWDKSHDCVTTGSETDIASRGFLPPWIIVIHSKFSRRISTRWELLGEGPLQMDLWTELTNYDLKQNYGGLNGGGLALFAVSVKFFVKIYFCLRERRGQPSLA